MGDYTRAKHIELKEPWLISVPLDRHTFWRLVGKLYCALEGLTPAIHSVGYRPGWAHPVVIYDRDKVITLLSGMFDDSVTSDLQHRLNLSERFYVDNVLGLKIGKLNMPVFLSSE